ncbi:porin [Paracoccus sp. Z330]|uniref:Porin n=1 Tax=Paracoccus onchidii TaxID=3017813 RepID=A0ABT4ZCZ5_9RHOB|nr:porin [Paracoccus onchidii]MDB6177235.1 porin [Paracoccus onchidii]
MHSFVHMHQPVTYIRMVAGAAFLALSAVGNADAQEREADTGHAPIRFRDITSLNFYGQANEGVLRFDDGEETSDYGIVANGNAVSRAGLSLTTDYDRGWTFFANFELGFLARPAREKTQIGSSRVDDGSDRTETRKLEASLSSPRGGRFWIGQGSMASDGSSEHDLSGTGLIASSNVSNMGGGLFRTRQGALSDVSTAAAFNNFDGLGRQFRLRYDTPTTKGVTFRVSYGTDVVNNNKGDLQDVAVSYGGNVAGRNLSAGLAYAHDKFRDAETISGSVSALDPGTGLSLTVATAFRQQDRDARYHYLKLGLQRDWFSAGRTALSIDHYSGRAIVKAGSTSRSWGIAAVQRMDNWNTDLFFGMRRYDYDDSSDAFQHGVATMLGMRIGF